MTLPSSGNITLAMVNVELGLPAGNPITLNDAAVRALAGVPSGAISMSDLWGKSHAWAYTMNVGFTSAKSFTSYGYLGGSYGSMSSTVFGPTGGTINQLNWLSSTGLLYLGVTGSPPNSGWSSITVNGVNYSRASASFSSGQWMWGVGNPFPSSGNINVTVYG
jgi:hypothetical protein